APRELLARQRALQLAQRLLPDDANFLALILLETLGFETLDFLCAIVLGDAAAREHTRVDHRPFDTRRHAQAGVAHLARLFAENRTQQFLFGAQLSLTLGRDLADQNIARANFRADADDAAGVEILEGVLTDVRNVAGNLLGAELGVARDTLEFLDMHRREEVFLDHALGNEDRILEVVAAPRHEGDHHVAAEGEFAHVGRGAIGDHVAGANAVALEHDRALVDTGVLVR